MGRKIRKASKFSEKKKKRRQLTSDSDEVRSLEDGVEEPGLPSLDPVMGPVLGPVLGPDLGAVLTAPRAALATTA